MTQKLNECSSTRQRWNYVHPPMNKLSSQCIWQPWYQRFKNCMIWPIRHIINSGNQILTIFISIITRMRFQHKDKFLNFPPTPLHKVTSYSVTNDYPFNDNKKLKCYKFGSVNFFSLLTNKKKCKNTQIICANFLRKIINISNFTCIKMNYLLY